VPYGTDSQLDVIQAMNCLATIIESLRDRILLSGLSYAYGAAPCAAAAPIPRTISRDTWPCESRNDRIFIDPAGHALRVLQQVHGLLKRCPNQSQGSLRLARVNSVRSIILELVHQVSDWGSGAAAYFGWMREAKRENTRFGL
jgi:hypothetical protein